MKLPLGKVPVDILEKIVYKNLGVKRGDVVQGPALGEDAAILRVGDRLFVTSCDPITGAYERIGWLAVNVSANDVATRGVRPRWFLSCILLPEGSHEDLVRKICNQIDNAARKLKIAVVGGHSEITPTILQPIVVGCMMGIAEDGRYVTSRDARPGDWIILTKGAGIEGTAILASDRSSILAEKYGESFVRKSTEFFQRVSVVEDAMTAFEIGSVSAMHDPTEGGVAGGLHEVADASNTGFHVYEEKIFVDPRTSTICNFFGVDPLQLISSGSLLIWANPGRSEQILDALNRRGIRASVIGKATKQAGRRVIERKDGFVEPLTRPVSDHLWVALTKKL